MPGSPKRVELLSVLAQQYANKELKEIFKLYKQPRIYDITKARASAPKMNQRPFQKLPLETKALVLELNHHPDSVEYSSYKNTSCEGKKKNHGSVNY